MRTYPIPPYEFKFSFSRSSGAGGQNVNKVNTKVTLLWPIIASNSLPVPVKNRFIEKFKNIINEEGILIIISQETRSQKMNKENCIQKLKIMISSVASPPKKRIKTKPSRASIQKRITHKKKKGDLKKQRQKNMNF